MLCAAVLTERAVEPFALLLLVVAGFSAAHRVALRWEALVSVAVLVVLFIPIKRYGLGSSLPFDLEPYRIVIALVLALWVAALLADPRVRLRGSALDGPFLALGLAVTASVALNPETITSFDVMRSEFGSAVNGLPIDLTATARIDVGANVAKELIFLASFLLTFYFVVSAIRSPRAIHSVLKVIVVGTSVVAAFALVERRFGYNVFDYLEDWIPFLDFEGRGASVRSGRLRVYASAQHPIALAVLFVTVFPLSLYLARQFGRRVWFAASVVILFGALSTLSRTSITMLTTVAVIFAILRWVDVKRLWPFVLPALIVIHIVIPGTITGLKGAFLPRQGIVADQTKGGGRVSSERLEPQFDVIRAQPLFGQGYGTRITAGENKNARILDNQWLATGVETGLVGVFAWLWLFARFIRRAGAEARRDLSGRGWLLTAVASSAASFAVAMLTLDSFSFIQSTFVFFVLLGLGSSVLAWKDVWPGRETAQVEPSDGGLPAERLASTPRKPSQRLLTS